jgi:hypothetical protein
MREVFSNIKAARLEMKKMIVQNMCSVGWSAGQIPSIVDARAVRPPAI